jgi:hypothetical protein
MRRIVGWRIQQALAYVSRTCAQAGDGGQWERGTGQGWVRERFDSEDWVERCDILLHRDLDSDDRILVFADGSSARGFLRQLATDSQCLAALRATLAEVSSLPPARLEDHEVVDQLGWDLVTGRVYVAVKLGPRPAGGSSAEPAPAPVVTSRSAPPSRRAPRPAPEPVETEPDPATCDNPSCHVAAARDGTPFIALGGS